MELDQNVRDKLKSINWWNKKGNEVNFGEVYYTTLYKEMLIRVYNDGSIYFGDEYVGGSRAIYVHAQKQCDRISEERRKERIAYFLDEEEG